MEDGKYFKVIMDALHSIGAPAKQGATPARGLYETHQTTMNTSDHGIPQNRQRWYCVGIRRGVVKTTDSRFTLPNPINCTPMPIHNLLDTTIGKGVEAESVSVANNIEKLSK